MNLITREIGIDMGHRIPEHHSKCRNMHGHRYQIKATYQSQQLISTGSQEGMVLDYGFAKEDMMKVIDEPCDHNFCLYARDAIVLRELGIELKVTASEALINSPGLWTQVPLEIGTFHIIGDIPTAENLARHWAIRLSGALREREFPRGHEVSVYQVEVYETPNCSAIYR